MAGSRRVEDVSPLAQPRRHLPIVDCSPQAECAHSTRVAVSPRICSPRRRIFPSASPRACLLMCDDERYFKIAAGCHAVTVFTRGLIRYTSLPSNEFTREAMRAKRAQTSGVETVANHQSSPCFHRQSLTSSNDSIFCRAAHNCGEVDGGCKSAANSSCAGAAEESLSCTSSAPTRTEDDSCNFNSPSHRSGNFRISKRASGSPHPRISRIWVADTPTALPAFRR